MVMRSKEDSFLAVKILSITQKISDRSSYVQDFCNAHEQFRLELDLDSQFRYVTLTMPFADLKA